MPRLTKDSIGIVGGAGPMAGVLLAQRLVEICQRDYQCQKDADFPRTILYSVPFAQMLLPGQQEQQETHVAAHLAEALEFLQGSGAKRIAIACNTLHAFLPPKADVVSFVAETERYIRQQGYRDVLMLTSSTSRSKGLYSFSGARWPDQRAQRQLDALIDAVLAGRGSPEALRELIERQEPADAVVLGCSELSVLMQGHAQRDLIDPLSIVAEVLCAA